LTVSDRLSEPLKQALLLVSADLRIGTYWPDGPIYVACFSPSRPDKYCKTGNKDKSQRSRQIATQGDMRLRCCNAVCRVSHITSYVAAFRPP